MSKDILISEINYKPIIPKDGHIGFVSFLVNDSIRLNNIGIYTRLNPVDGRLYRLVYPKNERKGMEQAFYPINQETNILIEKEITNYLENVLKK